jgi:hypothetical protein
MNQSLCPFCNAPLPPLAAPPAAEKLPCPRCGELVPAARWNIDAVAHSFREGAPLSPPMNSRARFAPANRKTAFIMLGIMLSMAIVSLSYILWTVNIRRSRHPWMPKKLEPIGQRRPLELDGLGYLPKDVHFLAGLHVAEMMDDKNVGRKLLEEPRPSFADWVFKQIARITALDADGIDHVVLAVTLDAPFPQLVMVVKTRAPYDLAQIAKSAKAAKTPLYKDRPLYEYSANPLGEALLWCVDDRVLVGVFRQELPTIAQLDALSPTPRPVHDVIPAALYDVMKERLRTPQFAWAAGRVDQLGPLRAWLPMELGSLKQMKTFVVGIEPVEELTLTGNFLMNDAKAAANFKTFLEKVNIEGAKSQKVDASEDWVAWQVRGDVATVRGFLNRGKERKK